MTVHGLGKHAAVSVSVPALQVLDPDKVYPLLHVGLQDAPSARLDAQSDPGTPLAIDPEASQGSALQTAVSVSVPRLQDLDPDKVYPSSHVGEQLDPLASEVGHGDARPLVMGFEASEHGLSFSQLEPSKPALQVHVHAPADPPTAPPLMQ